MASPRLVSEGAAPGVWCSVFGDVPFSLSIATFKLIKSAIGLRVSEEEAQMTATDTV